MLNWDLLAISFMLLAWHLWRRQRWELAGVVFAFGVFSKWFPIVVLVYCLVATWSRERKGTARRAATRMGVAALVTGFVINVPFMVANLRGWADFFTFNAQRASNSGVFYEIALLGKVAVPAVSYVDLIEGGVVCAIGVVLANQVRVGAMTPELAASIGFAAFLIINKDFSPQYVLWLLVLALISNWPAWTLAILAVVGVVDYANAIISLGMGDVSLKAYRWYRSTVDPIEGLLRDACISLTAVVALVCAKRATEGSTGRDGDSSSLKAQVVFSAEEIVGRSPDDLIRN